MSENIWNSSSRMINIAGIYELAIFDDKGIRVAIATGATVDACQINAAAIIEGLELRAAKLDSGNQTIKSLSADSK